MDRSLYFIDFLPLFFLLLFTYFYNEYIDIHIDDDEYIFESQVEPKKELSENEKLNNEFKKIINEYNKDLKRLKQNLIFISLHRSSVI